MSSILDNLELGQSQRTEHGSQLITVAHRSSQSLDSSSQDSQIPTRSPSPQASGGEDDLSEEEDPRENWLKEHPPQPAWEEDEVSEEAAAPATLQETKKKKSKSFIKKLSKGLFGKKK